MSIEKITKAFLENKRAKYQNDEVYMGAYYLYNHKIAEKINNKLYINSCGFQTKTTLNRLSAIGVKITQRKGQWFLKNHYNWNGERVNYTSIPEESIITKKTIFDEL